MFKLKNRKCFYCEGTLWSLLPVLSSAKMARVLTNNRAGVFCVWLFVFIHLVNCNNGRRVRLKYEIWHFDMKCREAEVERVSKMLAFLAKREIFKSVFFLCLFSRLMMVWKLSSMGSLYHLNTRLKLVRKIF